MIHERNVYIQEPKTIELGTTYTWEKLGGKSKLVETKNTFQYVPILDSIASIVGNKDLYDEVFKFLFSMYANKILYYVTKIFRSINEMMSLLKIFVMGLFKSHPRPYK